MKKLVVITIAVIAWISQGCMSGEGPAGIQMVEVSTNCFVGKQGLHLMRSPYHEAYEEDFLTFDMIEFHIR